MSMQELKATLETQQYIGLQKIQRHRERPSYLFSKRGLDVICSLFGLIILLPIFLIIGILIKLEDPKGSVFFVQTRIGKNGKPFKIFKFRSMMTSAEDMLHTLLDKNEVSGAMFKMKNDPRVSRIGRLLRKSSIDELPQLWNVLMGDMSLVGPRPPLPREVKMYTAYDMQRLLVIPGCTGLWQVTGRNSTSFQDMVEIDLKYISERNFMIDLFIILKTVRVFFGSKHAF
ncbi:sugar transferase [Cohnella suwonensis]|uniref:Sugar transferase n=1 Tax=Cohnella suwonensis TaxID=696072 RepID=A0ABW0M5F3_9BACL